MNAQVTKKLRRWYKKNTPEKNQTPQYWKRVKKLYISGVIQLEKNKKPKKAVKE